MPLAEFDDPELSVKEDRTHVLRYTFDFMVKSLRQFVHPWAVSAQGRRMFEQITEHAQTLGVAQEFAIAAALNSEEGTRALQLPLKVLKPEEGEDYPRPKFPSRYARKPVI